MAGEFDTGGMVTTSVEAWPRSVSSFAGEEIRVLDSVVREIVSSPLKKGLGFLNGVGAKRSGNGSAVGYIGSVKVIGNMYRLSRRTATVGTSGRWSSSNTIRSVEELACGDASLWSRDMTGSGEAGDRTGACAVGNGSSAAAESNALGMRESERGW